MEATSTRRIVTSRSHNYWAVSCTCSPHIPWHFYNFTLFLEFPKKEDVLVCFWQSGDRRSHHISLQMLAKGAKRMATWCAWLRNSEFQTVNRVEIVGWGGKRYTVRSLGGGPSVCINKTQDSQSGLLRHLKPFLSSECDGWMNETFFMTGALFPPALLYERFFEVWNSRWRRCTIYGY